MPPSAVAEMAGGFGARLAAAVAGRGPLCVASTRTPP